MKLDSAISSDCHYCLVVGYIDAVTATGQETGPERQLPVEHQTMELLLAHVPR